MIYYILVAITTGIGVVIYHKRKRIFLSNWMRRHCQPLFNWFYDRRLIEYTERQLPRELHHPDVHKLWLDQSVWSKNKEKK